MSNKNVITTMALALAVAGGASGVASADPEVKWTGTTGEIRDGDARFKMRGRFQFDVLDSDWDVLNEDGMRSFTRRAFLGVQGRLTEHWRYKVDFVLTPGASEASGSGAPVTSVSGGADDVGVDDAFLEYVGQDWSIVIGEHNVTSPLEDRTSSLDIQFNERSSFINAFDFGRRAGIGFIMGGGNWSAAAAVQGDSLNNADSSFARDESTAISGRFTFAPIFQDSAGTITLLHLGVSARHRESADDGNIRYRTRPLNGRGSRWIDSGGLGDSDNTYGAEVAFQQGPFGLQAEYAMLEGETPAGVSYDYDGYYVDAFFSLTGESRRYDAATGAFKSIVPRAPLGAGGIGHWMLTARYDSLDLSDPAGGGSRGEQEAYAVGLGWVPIDHVRFNLNYAQSEMDRVVGTDDEAQIISLRTQFDF